MTAGARVAAAFAVALAAAPAHAGPVLVLESYGGQRPQDADAVLAPVFEELAARGYAVGRDAAQLVERHVSRSGGALTEEELATARRLITQAHQRWIDGDFADVVSYVERALALYRGAPATIARDQMQRDMVERGLIIEAMALRRLGQEDEAFATMAEYIRSFPDRDVNRRVYGPEAVRLYRDVKSELDRQERAALQVTVDEPAAVVFVNERFVAVGGADLRDLHPGMYRVYVQFGDAPGRAHFVDVAPGREHSIAVTWALDAALRTRAFTGFAFADGKARAAHESEFAVRVASAAGASGVVVLGIDGAGGRREVVGTVYSLDKGKVLRSAALTVANGTPPGQLRALARYLAGDEASPGIEVRVGPARSAVVAAAPDDSGGSGRRKLAGVAFALGGIGAIAGGVLIARDGEPNCPDSNARCPEVYDTLVPGIGVSAAAAVLLGAGVYLWVTADDDGEGGGARAGIAPTRGGAEAFVTVRF
ncbi:MAG: hypothetical protein D6689_22660 [Deltaproteobacteria bacterium]|nr:MAG: hypothetical protein D6689_22660 [Deltaproteobacteria bacterium]